MLDGTVHVNKSSFLMADIAMVTEEEGVCCSAVPVWKLYQHW